MTYKVKNQVKYVKHLEEYTNGILTTGGLYKKEELEEIPESDAYLVLSISYSGEGLTELPIDYLSLLWLDENNKRQHIKEVNFTGLYCVMEDGSISREVTL